MADEIKQKIVLEGEKEYSAALKEANRNLKTLKSQLKAETAELGNNASAQQKNETKSRSLRKQIAEQEKVVATLQSALKQVKTTYGDNSDEVAKWEQKLNNARYTLASMNNDLEKTEADLKSSQDALQDNADAYGDAADAAADYANATDSAGQIADSVTFSSVMTAADNLKDKLTGAISLIKQVGKSAWNWMTESGEWADTLTTNATKWGVDRETLQGWEYASKFVDTEVETIAQAFTKLTNRSDSVNKKLSGIGIKAQSGVSAQDLFWEVVEALEEMDKTARDNAAKDIFGKSYQELLPLITAGKEAWEDYVKEAEESGYILSDEEIDNLTKFDDARQKLETSVESLKLTVASSLAPAFETIATSLGSMVDKFTEWAGTEQGQQTLTELGQALENIVTSLTGEVDFQGIVNTATEAIKGLTSALGWISEHQGEVVAGIGAVGLAVAGLEVSKTFLSALQLIKSIKWGSLPSGGASAPGGAAGGAGASAGSAAGTAASAEAGSGGGWFSSLSGVVGLSAIIAGFIAAANERINNEHIRGSEQAILDTTGGNSGLLSSFEKYVQANRELQELFNSPDYSDEAANNLLDAVEAAKEELYGQEGATDLMQAYSDWLQENSFGSDSWEMPDFSELPDWMYQQDAELLTSSDVQGLLALPEQVETAVARGAASGTSGLQINMDGYSVATITAPYVSQIIASEMN